MAVEDAIRTSLPTEDAPELGCAVLHGVDLSEAEHWIEDGEHVLRSLEFDVIAGAPTFGEALHKFIGNILDYGIYLGELEDRADNEDEMFNRLAPRILRVSREMERGERRLRKRRMISVNLPSRRKTDDHVRGWHKLSRPHGLSARSHA